jgi:glucose-1-phosphate thymidylyltransferase
VNKVYLECGKLQVEKMRRGYAWLDTGTMESLLEASEFVHMIEKRQGMKISAPEEIAYRHKWINREQLLACAEKYGKSPYGKHLHAVADEKIVK